MQTRAIRNLCYALVLAITSTLIPPLAKPASAQLMSQYAVGVTDFMNESGVQGDLLARLATDAVVVEMSKTNRYDVSITRTQMKQKMDDLALHPPLTKLDIVRLGEALQADAMLQGAIKSVQLAGSGPTRRASVTLVVQMVDQASGEIVNGAVQTGQSSARVGYTPDDNALITEAVNSAAFLAVRTMIDYVIPEATVMMNVGGSQVMINKGSREGIKPGMRMIVLRDKEIIGYLDVTSADPGDAYARVIKSMRGIQPQDKARAIFEMPMVSSSLKSEPLPSGAPKSTGMGGGAASKIGKFLLGAAIVFGLASIFTGGNGNPDAPHAGANGVVLTWDPKLYNHGQNVFELQVIRDQNAGDVGAFPVRAISDLGQWNSGATNIGTLYNSGGVTPVAFNQLPLGATTPTAKNWDVPQEPYGTTHRYQLRALLRTQKSIAQDGTPTYVYKMTKFGNVVTATAVQPVAQDLVTEPVWGGPMIVMSLKEGGTTLAWKDYPRSGGGNQFRVTVWPVNAGAAPTWTSSLINLGAAGGLELPDADRLLLAKALSDDGHGGVDYNLYADQEMNWRVDTRHVGDTSAAWTEGDTMIFRIEAGPPGH